MLLSVVRDSVKSATDLNHDLDMISQWVNQWKMEFNPDPSKQATEVLFSCKKNRANHPQLIFNGSAVVEVNEQKHLGLIQALVRSHLDYCDVIYHIPSITHQLPLGMTLSSVMEKVEVQYQAALAITGAWQGSSRSKNL